jgi:hypothetical protein
MPNLPHARQGVLLTCCSCVANVLLPVPMPNLPHARQEQEDQEAGGRHHRCACHPADGLGKQSPLQMA